MDQEKRDRIANRVAAGDLEQGHPAASGEMAHHALQKAADYMGHGGGESPENTVDFLNEALGHIVTTQSHDVRQGLFDHYQQLMDHHYKTGRPEQPYKLSPLNPEPPR